MIRRKNNYILQKKDKTKGFTLIELLVALAAFSIVMIAITDIFFMGLSGTKMIFGRQGIQESGRFIMESMSKEIRMSKINTSAGEPYLSLNLTNSNGQTLDYSFDNVNKIIQRDGIALSPNEIEVTGGFYVQQVSIFQPRVTIVMALKNKTAKTSQQTKINLQTTVSSREYGDVIPSSTPTPTPSPGPTAPTNLVLSQSTGSKSFSVSWTAGTDNGGADGCKLQFNQDSSTWTDITSGASVNCDVDLSEGSFTLNDDGWKANWNSTQVRLVRKSDSTAVGTFPQTLACASTSGSVSATPTIDEDCNGYWDNNECATCTHYQVDYYTAFHWYASTNGTCAGAGQGDSWNVACSEWPSLSDCQSVASGYNCDAAINNSHCLTYYGIAACDRASAVSLPATCHTDTGSSCNGCGYTYY